MYEQLLLLGDSITEFSTQYKDGLAPRLANKYARQLDIVTRGYSGYTTTMLRGVLPQILAHLNSTKVACCVLFIGTNDSVLPGEPQHVPLEQTAENLKAIIASISKHTSNIIVITPGIIDEQRWPNRSTEFMKAYVDLISSLGAELVGQENVLQLANLFNNDTHLLSDGLHFTNDGYVRLLHALEPMLDRLMLPETQLPNWRSYAGKSYKEIELMSLNK